MWETSQRPLICIQKEISSYFLGEKPRLYSSGISKWLTPLSKDITLTAAIFDRNCWNRNGEHEGGTFSLFEKSSHSRLVQSPRYIKGLLPGDGCESWAMKITKLQNSCINCTPFEIFNKHWNSLLQNSKESSEMGPLKFMYQYLISNNLFII